MPCFLGRFGRRVLCWALRLRVAPCSRPPANPSTRPDTQPRMPPKRNAAKIHPNIESSHVRAKSHAHMEGPDRERQSGPRSFQAITTLGLDRFVLYWPGGYRTDAFFACARTPQRDSTDGPRFFWGRGVKGPSRPHHSTRRSKKLPVEREFIRPWLVTPVRKRTTTYCGAEPTLYHFV
jgi:hypothetical protein